MGRCHGHVPAYFFSLRASYVTGHWSVTGRSAGQGSCVWPGGQARRWFCLGRLAGKMSFFVCYFGLCNVNWKTLMVSLLIAI